MTDYTLGVDIGTFETKGVLVDRDGEIVASAARRHRMLTPRPGWAEHRAEEDWWGDFVFVTRAILNDSGVDPSAVRAVACSAIGPCMLPLDADGAPLTNGVLYGVDTRAMAEVEELTDSIGAERVLDHCGAALTAQSVGPKILWLKRERPDIWAKTAEIHTSTSFLVRRLTGERVIDHYTAVSFAPLYDVATRDWRFDLGAPTADRAMLPRLAWSTEIAGRIHARAAAETGLAEGTPVTAGTIDAAAEAVSVGVREPGDMMMMYGSTIFIILATAERVRDGRLFYAPWLFPDRHASMAGLATSGTLTHWFRDHCARELDPDVAFATLAAEAASVPPGADGLLFLPYFSGERTPIHDPHAKGCWFGLNLTHTRAHLYRALLEGIAYGVNHVAETYAGAGAKPARLYAVGGGVKNDVWVQAISDVTGLDQIVRRRTVGASYGDALLARIALGEADETELERWNPVERTVSARPTPAYEAAYPLFRRLYEQTKDVMRALSGR